MEDLLTGLRPKTVRPEIMQRLHAIMEAPPSAHADDAPLEAELSAMQPAAPKDSLKERVLEPLAPEVNAADSKIVTFPRLADFAPIFKAAAAVAMAAALLTLWFGSTTPTNQSAGNGTKNSGDPIKVRLVSTIAHVSNGRSVEGVDRKFYMQDNDYFEKRIIKAADRYRFEYTDKDRTVVEVTDFMEKEVHHPARIY